MFSEYHSEHKLSIFFLGKSRDSIEAYHVFIQSLYKSPFLNTFFIVKLILKSYDYYAIMKI